MSGCGCIAWVLIWVLAAPILIALGLMGYTVLLVSAFVGVVVVAAATMDDGR